jgi:hypothetical protein
MRAAARALAVPIELRAAQRGIANDWTQYRCLRVQGVDVELFRGARHDVDFTCLAGGTPQRARGKLASRSAATWGFKAAYA